MFRKALDVPDTEAVLLVQYFYWGLAYTTLAQTRFAALAQHSFSSQFTIASQAKHFQSARKAILVSIMFMRYVNLAILVSAALSQSVPEPANSNDVARQLGDFDWAIAPEDGYPIINFNDTNVNSEVIFKYNYTGNLTGSKYLFVQLFESDCATDADATALAIANNTDGDVLNINLDIVQETITNSSHYEQISAAEAAISFCLRVDYNYVDGNETESINFYETNVTITVDLTANFTLTTIAAERTLADNEAADIKLDYPVTAYICEDNNTLVDSPPALAQGSFLQVCVKIDETVTTNTNILVEDILTFVVSQPNNTLSSDSETITDSLADDLTDKVCRESGICNVKTQLLSKFFTEPVPSALRIDGVAILAFGKASLMPSGAPTPSRRRLRAVPIRGLITGDDVKAFMNAQQKNLDKDESGVSVISVVSDSSQRMLQEDGENQSDFGLDVALQGIEGDSGDGGSSSSGSSSIIVAAVVLIVLAAGCCFGFVACTKRNRKEDPKDIVDHDSSNASARTYPNQASINSSSSSQHVSHRTRDQQIN
jgi:hypothetical protein